jgi:hypothetical protein
MYPPVYISFAVIIVLYALAWHDQPSRTLSPARASTSSPSSKPSHMGWARLAIWSCAVLSLAAWFFAAYIIWGESHGGRETLEQPSTRVIANWSFNR